MSVMVGSVTESLAPDEDFLQFPNSTVNEAARDAARVQLASTLSVLVGLFQVRSRQKYVPPTPLPDPLQPPSASSPKCLTFTVFLIASLSALGSATPRNP